MGSNESECVTMEEQKMKKYIVDQNPNPTAAVIENFRQGNIVFYRHIKISA